MRLVQTIALGVSLWTAAFVVAAESPAWQTTVKVELARVHKLGLDGPYSVSSSRIHVPVTWSMADALNTPSRKNATAFLEQLKLDPSYQGLHEYLSRCIQGLNFGERSTPTMRVFSNGDGQWVVYLNVPISTLFAREPNKSMMPNQSSQPTRPTGG